MARFVSGGWNIAGTIAIVVGAVMCAIGSSRANALQESRDIIRKDDSGECCKKESQTDVVEAEHNTPTSKWQDREQAKPTVHGLGI